MAKKPVNPGDIPSAANKNDKPEKDGKKKITDTLVAKGVEPGLAKQLSGEDEDLTREQIASRRIAWQRTLPKA